MTEIHQQLIQIKPNLNDLLVTENSEYKEDKETTRHEIYLLFGLWSTSFDKEEKDIHLRNDVRRQYIHELEKSGATIKYVFCNRNKNLMVEVTWRGQTAEYIVVTDMHIAVTTAVRIAARNAFIALLKKLKLWPVPNRPVVMPNKMVPVYLLSKPISSQTNIGKVSSPIQITKVTTDSLATDSLATDSLSMGSLSTGSLSKGSHKKIQGFSTNTNTQVNQVSSDNINIIIERPDTIKDLNAYKRYVKQITNIELNEEILNKLYILFKLFHDPDIQKEPIEYDPNNKCIMGFISVNVKQPEFYQKILELIKNKTLRTIPQSTNNKKPTWFVYNLLRKIGVVQRKHSRGPEISDPGKKEFMYATTWVFKKDKYNKNHHEFFSDRTKKKHISLIDQTNIHTSVSASIPSQIVASAQIVAPAFAPKPILASASASKPILASASAFVFSPKSKPILASVSASKPILASASKPILASVSTPAFVYTTALASSYAPTQIVAPTYTPAHVPSIQPTYIHVHESESEVKDEDENEDEDEDEEVLQAKLEAMDTKVKAMRTKLEHYKKTEEAKARAEAKMIAEVIAEVVAEFGVKVAIEAKYEVMSSELKAINDELEQLEQLEQFEQFNKTKEKVEKTQSQYSQLSPPNVIAKPVVYDNKSFYSYISKSSNQLKLQQEQQEKQLQSRNKTVVVLPFFNNEKRTINSLSEIEESIQKKKR